MAFDYPENITEATALMRTRNACAELAKSSANAVGFIPRDEYIHAKVEGRLKEIRDGEELIGFALHSPLNAIVRVHQEVVHATARRNAIGAAMYMALYQQCLETNVERIILHCATELESNFFWSAMGLRCTGTREAGSATKRPANRWEIVFAAGEQLEAAVAEIMEAPKTKKLAEFLGISESLKKGLDNRFRRRLFPGSKLRRTKREGQ